MGRVLRERTPSDEPAEARPSPAPAAPAALSRALERTAQYLRTRQLAGGHWVGTLSSSALATAMAIVALQLADPARYRDRMQRGRRWLLQTQAADGGWGDAVVDAANINATSLALAALVYTAGADEDPTDPPGLQRARARLDLFGGLAAVGDPQRCTLSGPCRSVAALAGLMDWQRIKALRPEVILLPRQLRRTISTTFAAYLSLALLHTHQAPRPLNALPTYRRASNRALDWLARAQGPNGSFEESAFLTAVIITGMLASGRRQLAWLPAAIDFVAASQREDGSWPIDRDLETFDTSLTVLALHELGAAIPRAERARDWLLARQLTAECFPTGAPPGGWAWAMPSGWPDTDDTSYTVLALLALGLPANTPALRRGAHWLEQMQNRDGSWSTFVRDSSMPFDHACPYIIGHVLCALEACGRLARRPEVLARALTYLARVQRYDGSFGSVWFREAMAGTSAVVEALADCGLAHSDMARRARAYLLGSQNEDGGWAGLRGQAGTAEETAWALMALLRCPMDEASQRALRAGAGWLIAEQRADGTWTAAPIGLYYSAMWYADSHYAVALPLRALARAQAHGQF